MTILLTWSGGVVTVDTMSRELTSDRLRRKLLPTDAITLGAWVATTAGQTHIQAMTAFSQLAGANPVIDHRFYGTNDTWPAGSHPAFPDQIAMVTWEPWDATLDQIIAGNLDLYFSTRINACKALGIPILFRPMHEMNGNWYPWSGASSGANLPAPRKYIRAWRHIRDLFTAHRAGNVYFVWCPNHNSVPDTPWNLATNYYPGPRYVDYIGVDGYNFGNPDLTPAQIFADFYRTFSSYGKPMLICETSSADAPVDKAEWIAQLDAWLPTAPQIDGVVWFHENKEHDWRIDSSPTALNAFKTMIADWNTGELP